jgi:hypothetical protein
VNLNLEVLSIIGTFLATVSSLGLLIVNLSLAAKFHELKVYMHEKFVTKEEAANALQKIRSQSPGR